MFAKILLALPLLALAPTLDSSSSGIWNQGYTRGLGGFPSTVQSSTVSDPQPVVVVDDFILETAATIQVIDWWSIPIAPWLYQREQQLSRKYYIAIYPSLPGGVAPQATPVFEASVTPDWRFWDFGCGLEEVYRQWATLPQPVTLDAGHYWLQISEDDSDSVQVGLVNFRWAAHREIAGSGALGTINFQAFGQLMDPCDGARDDLAFTLR